MKFASNPIFDVFYSIFDDFLPPYFTSLLLPLHQKSKQAINKFTLKNNNEKTILSNDAAFANGTLNRWHDRRS